MATIRLAQLLLVATTMIAPSIAQTENYTVWSSFIFLRAGDHSPGVLSTMPTHLTSLGAQQMYSAGQYFRSVYLQSGSSSKIAALSADEPNQEQVDISTIDTQYTSASTQAFMLGMYPPTTIGSSNTSSATLDSTDILANGSTIEGPLGGINFPQISAAGPQDVNAIYVSGDSDCDAFIDFTHQGVQIANSDAIKQEAQADYNAIQSVLDPIFSRSQQTFDYAQSIYSFVDYQHTYNRSVSSQLSDDSTLMDRLRYYANAQQTGFYGNLKAKNPYSRSAFQATTGSISTIAGASLASRIASTFYTEQYILGSATRLSVYVGDYGPMLSLFTLLNLPSRNTDFNGLPLPGSALVLELVTPASNTENLTNNNLPSPTELQVRFRFRNGTGVGATSTANLGGGDLVTYPLFSRANSDMTMPYKDFADGFSKIAISGPGDWCQQCGAQTLFCAAWNSTISFSSASDNGANGFSPKRDGLSAPVAGAVGAVAALVIAGVVAALLFWLCGVRFRRTEPLWVSAKRRHEMGGFKGGNKMASDTDLSSPRAKDGTIVGASIVRGNSNGSEKGRKNRFSADPEPGMGHERMGSWEMKDSPSASPQTGTVRGLGVNGAEERQGGWGHGQGGLRAEEVEFYKPGWPNGRRIIRDSEGTLVERDMGHMGLDGARMGWGSVAEGDRRPSTRAGTAPVPVVNERESGMMEREPGRRMSADSDKVDPFRDPVKVAEGL